MNSIQSIVKTYYDNVVKLNIPNFEKLLPENFSFKSLQDIISTRDDFIRICTRYMEGLSNVNVIKEVYSEEKAFLVLEWISTRESKFYSAEYLEVKNGILTEIVIINNSPDFWAKYN